MEMRFLCWTIEGWNMKENMGRRWKMRGWKHQSNFYKWQDIVRFFQWEFSEFPDTFDNLILGQKIWNENKNRKFILDMKSDSLTFAG